MNGKPRPKWLLLVTSLIFLGLAGSWWVAGLVEDQRISRAGQNGSPGFGLAVRVQVASPPEYGVSADELEQVVDGVIRARAPWVSFERTARNRVELSVELNSMEGNPKGYHGWVRMAFYRARWVPRLTIRRPDWSDRILVFGVPPKLGSPPKDNVRGAVRIISENLVTKVLSSP